ncbi:UNVERIFIED_CONTAM: hypothetical protein O8I53_11200 [Campylobacter lari]
MDVLNKNQKLSLETQNTIKSHQIEIIEQSSSNEKDGAVNNLNQTAISRSNLKNAENNIQNNIETFVDNSINEENIINQPEFTIDTEEIEISTNIELRNNECDFIIDTIIINKPIKNEEVESKMNYVQFPQNNLIDNVNEDNKLFINNETDNNKIDFQIETEEISLISDTDNSLKVEKEEFSFAFEDEKTLEIKKPNETENLRNDDNSNE